MQEKTIKAYKLDDYEQWYKQLINVGAVVIKNVISQEQVRKTTDLFWDWLEQLDSGIKRDEPITWRNNAWPGVSDLGFFSSYGGCHTRASWYLRCHPRVQQVFKKIWNCQDLITSFDTLIAWRPWWVDQTWRPFVQNLHLDQNPFHKKGLKCVQGMIPLKRVRKQQIGGLMVVPYTNNQKTQSELCERYPHVLHQRGDWLELKSNDPYIGNGILVECEAGDMILWDSRTIHGGIICQPRNDFKNANTHQLVRLSQTVTMVPRQWASKDIIERRKNAFKKRIALTHWPHQYNVSGMATISPQIDSDNIKYEWVQLTPDIEKLI